MAYNYVEPSRSKLRPGKTFSAGIKFTGRECPVAAGTPVSVWTWQCWVALSQPENFDWTRVKYWRYRYPDGRATATPTIGRSVELPTDEDHARAMIATARDWLERHACEVI